jgi:3-deoxy-manno-octulosonate cytidylyltransferase (CMP-KDO synthetase)
VKAVFDDHGRALYFSRAPVPHVRDWDEALLSADPPLFYQHMGLYAYRRSFLLKLAHMPPCPLEQAEKLEQLRVLNMGETIRVGVVEQASSGIDTHEDYAAFVARQKQAA